MRDHYSGGGAKACLVECVICWKEVIRAQLLVPSVSKIKRPAEPHKHVNKFSSGSGARLIGRGKSDANRKHFLELDP
jgi:hypothetical protein